MTWNERVEVLSIVRTLDRGREEAPERSDHRCERRQEEAVELHWYDRELSLPLRVQPERIALLGPELLDLGLANANGDTRAINGRSGADDRIAS